MEKTKEKAYTRTVGRRKTSSATVKLTPSTKNTFMINGKEARAYFNTPELFQIISNAFATAKMEEKFDITVNVKGGGIHSQAEAVRHGLSRALIIIDEETKLRLKKAGFLKRDPRMKERRKFGLKKARKAPQWSKR